VKNREEVRGELTIFLMKGILEISDNSHYHEDDFKYGNKIEEKK